MNGPWILVALLVAVLVVLVAIAIALSLRLVSERRSTPLDAKNRDRPPGRRTTESIAEMAPRRSSGPVTSPKGMKLINEYGAVMELYAGYIAGVSERVLPAHPDAIEAALTSAIMADPSSEARSALELGIMGLAVFLPDPDGSRGMELHESITSQDQSGAFEPDQEKLIQLLKDDEDGDDLTRLMTLVAERSSEKSEIVKRLQRAYPHHRSQSDRISEYPAALHAPVPNTHAVVSRRSIRSSNIVSVGYDMSSLTLQVEFRDGSLYEYDGVPQRVYDDLLASPSAGSYFHSAVKRVFRYRRIG